ncbi:alpha/beta hydrolase [Clostridium sp. JS66]|uniref:alpha/beta fold hydrolase n=1 Tax=Clostridium sp. JS66 TaxID=3064705 RepID=UPI00298E38B2|nr:alpha/beta hydrolase [Clostridium sp. JS66]WPC43037.1 alpha/beta hydrolase [Clostridium sp. JS66]
MEKVKIYRNMAKLKNIDMFYLDTKTEGTTILCLHGRYGRAETWYDFINHYGKQYRIIAPDQRGHGLSSKSIISEEYTPEKMAEDIIQLINFLKIDSVILVGHSMGGRVAGYLTALYPKFVKALSLLDISSSKPEESNQLCLDKSELIDPFTKDWPLPFATLNEAMNFIKQAASSNLEYQYFMNSLVESIEGYEMMFNSQAVAAIIAHYEDWFHLLPNINCPVLLIRSKSHEAIPDNDFIKMQSLISNCLVHEMSHPDHNVHLGNKEEFYKYFDEFLNKISIN